MTRRSGSKVEILVKEGDREEISESDNKIEETVSEGVEKSDKEEAVNRPNPKEVRRSLSNSSRLSSSSSGISSIEEGGGAGKRSPTASPAATAAATASAAAAAAATTAAAKTKLQQLQERRGAYYHPSFANHLVNNI